MLVWRLDYLREETTKLFVIRFLKNYEQIKNAKSEDTTPEEVFIKEYLSMYILKL